MCILRVCWGDWADFCVIDAKKASVAETAEDQLPEVDESSVGALSDEV